MSAGLAILLTTFILFSSLETGKQPASSQARRGAATVDEIQIVSARDFTDTTMEGEYVIYQGARQLDPADFRKLEGGLQLRGPVRIFSRNVVLVQPDAVYLAVLKLRLPVNARTAPLPFLAAGLRNLLQGNSVLQEPDDFSRLVHSSRLSVNNLFLNRDNVASISGLIVAKDDPVLPALPAEAHGFDAFIGIAPGGSEQDVELLSFKISRVSGL